ncbi:MAG: hypothetical protein ACREJM_08415 [Candidatus Saccharimonadales bacterium]
MQLDVFVKTTLEQIISGVVDAQASAAQHGASVNPNVRSAQAGRAVHHSGAVIQDVQFDVAVSVTESEKSGAGLKVGIPWVGGGIEGGSSAQHGHESRIKFVVSLALPVQSGS